MDFDFTAADDEFRREFRSWLEANRSDAPPPRDIFMTEGKQAFEEQVRWGRKLAEGGWLAVNWPKEYGGRGATVLQTIVYGEELARLGLAAPMMGLGTTLLGPTLLHWGTDEQKQRYIPKILKAEEIWYARAIASRAPVPTWLRSTRAVEDGDDFIVNGQKVWTSLAQFADMIFLLVRTDPDAPKHKGISYLLVDMHGPGVTVRPLVEMTGNRGFNEVFFEDVRVPKKNLVGEKNQGWQVAMTTLMFERSGIGGGDGGALGMCRELAELARKLPRNGCTAWDDASVRQKVAELYCEAVAIKYTGYRQLTRRLKGLPPGPEGSMMKLCGTELNHRMQLFAMELLGPYSQLENHAEHAYDKGIWSFRMLASRGGTIAAGSNQIQHNIIGERILGLPKG